MRQSPWRGAVYSLSPPALLFVLSFTTKVQQPEVESPKKKKKYLLFATGFKGQININPLMEDDFNIPFSSTYVIM